MGLNEINSIGLQRIINIIDLSKSKDKIGINIWKQRFKQMKEDALFEERSYP